MTYRDNDITFSGPSGDYKLEGLECTITGHSVTSGQDPDKKIANGQVRSFSGMEGSIRFRVGRKGSSSPALWWKGQIRASENTFNHDPAELNFALVGTLKLKVNGVWYTIPNAGLTQGHTANAVNNWGFGAKGAEHVGAIGGINRNTVAVQGTAPDGKKMWFAFLRGVGIGIGNIEPRNDASRVEIVSIGTTKPIFG